MAELPLSKYTSEVYLKHSDLKATSVTIARLGGRPDSLGNPGLSSVPLCLFATVPVGDPEEDEER